MFGFIVFAVVMTAIGFIFSLRDGVELKTALTISSIIAMIMLIIGGLIWLSSFPVFSKIMEIIWRIILFALVAGISMPILVKAFKLTKKSLPLILLVFGLLFVVWISFHFTGNSRESRVNPMGDYIPVVESDRH